MKVIRQIRAFIAITIGLLVVDWMLGMACANRILPLFVFLLFNIPFGVAYVFMESSWVGLRYEVGGRIVPEHVVAIVEFGGVFAQAVFYYILWYIWQRRRTQARCAQSVG